MYNLKFFTDLTVKNDYLLIKLKRYLQIKNKSVFKKYKEIFIDPGVYELKKTKKDCYSWEKHVNVEKFLDLLPNNCYFSFDYPSDMNPALTDVFLKKSYENAVKYQNNEHFIISMQYRFKDFFSFCEEFEKYNDLNHDRIFALGNLCRILRLTPFLKNVILYTIKKITPQAHSYLRTLSSSDSIRLYQRFEIQKRRLFRQYKMDAR